MFLVGLMCGLHCPHPAIFKTNILLTLLSIPFKFLCGYTAQNKLPHEISLIICKRYVPGSNSGRDT